MKAYFLSTATGAMIILTSYDNIISPKITSSLEAKGVKKFIANELPLKMIKERYAAHYDNICNDPDQTDELRVFEEDGERAYGMVSLDELGPPIYYEPKA